MNRLFGQKVKQKKQQLQQQQTNRQRKKPLQTHPVLACLWIFALNPRRFQFFVSRLIYLESYLCLNVVAV